MIEFVLNKEIERRVKTEMLADDYYIEPVLVEVDTENKQINLGTSIYFLINESLSIPVVSKLRLESPDNYFITSPVEFELLKHHKVQSFRNNINIKLSNYGTFTPFVLEFLKVTPLKNYENEK